MLPSSTVPLFRYSHNTRETGRQDLRLAHSKFTTKGVLTLRNAKNHGFTLLAVGLLCYQYLMFVAFSRRAVSKTIKMDVRAEYC